MKYSEANPPIQCIMTGSTCYKKSKTFEPKGILWHSTGAPNTQIRRYCQPNRNDINYTELINLIGKNQYGNDWEHIDRAAGVNFWIGTLADESVATVQALPDNMRPWGCGSGSKGSCNNTHIQFEICEPKDLKDRDYFDAVYQEACELTAYLCIKYNIDPNGVIQCGKVSDCPTILCHQDSYKLGLGNNHSDVLHWFGKHGKTMQDVRNDVAEIINEYNNSKKATEKKESKTNDDANDNQDKIYKVYSGAFTKKDNAVKHLTSLYEKEEDGIIIFDSKYYRVQLGAFSLMESAKKLQKKLQEKEIKTLVKTE